MYQVFFSNRTECLFTRLKEMAFQLPSTPFSRRLLIVPSPAMKSWIMLQMANEIGIAAGLEVVYLDQAIDRLFSTFHISSKRLSQLELALAIENQIRTVLSKNCSSIWLPLIKYLGYDSETFSKKGKKRLTALSEALADLFRRYGIYGGSLPRKWELEQENDWQKELWKSLFVNWSYPQRDILSFDPKETYDIQVHLFGISFIPKLYHDFLMKLCYKIPITYYLLSPCQAFWNDIVSDKQSHRLQKYWKEQGISQAQQIALEEFLRDRNPLLANFGRIGREMALQIEESEAITSEEYVLPSSLTAIVQYDELMTEDVQLEKSKRSLSLLEAVQADMTLLRTPDANNKISLQDSEHSIQIHIASSKEREIQILHDSLLHIINKNQICLSDIIVMIPDIHAYIPYIKAIFNNAESPINAQIMDVQMPSSSPLIQGFLHLLSLTFSRWDATSILQLFDYSHFQKKHQFTHEEIRQIRDWIKNSETRWGLDPLHRDDLLKQDHGVLGMVESSEIGTWEFAINRLLSGLALKISDDPVSSMETKILPIEEIDSMQGELLGKWIKILRSLRDDLQFLQNEFTLREWSLYLISLYESYFSPGTNDDENDFALRASIEAITKAANVLGELSLPFSSIHHHLVASLNQQTSSYKESGLQAVRFCALLPMRAIPAKVIAMVGMHAGAFPRHDLKTSLNLMPDEGDYCPSRIDYDRYLFLEAVLSARQYLLMTYQGYFGGKDQPPSLVISELLSYLDKSYVLEGKRPSDLCVKKHPFLPFDKAYFSKGSEFVSYSKNQFNAAQAYYKDNKKLVSAFIPDFHSNEITHEEKQIRIEIRELAAFAKNPLKTYFNKTLGIYLPKDEDREIKNDENFQVSHLEHYFIQQDSMKKPLENILQLSEKQGKLPVGPFKTVALEKIRKDISQLWNKMEKLGVETNEIFQINCSVEFSKPSQSLMGDWQLPPLSFECQGRKIEIVGQLNQISPQGMLAHIEDSRSDLVKIWPQFLIFSCLIKQHNLPIAPCLLITKGKGSKCKEAFLDDPQAALINYIEYYLTALVNASPLIPEWIPQLMTLDPAPFGEHMKESISSKFQPLYNDYINWTVNGTELPSSESIFTDWKTCADGLFTNLYSHWSPSKNKQGPSDGTI